MKIGDLIISRKHSGIHEVTSIKRRFKSKSLRGLTIYDENDTDAGIEMQPQVSYKKKYLITGVKETMSREYVSEMNECKLAIPFLETEIENLKERIKRYENIIKEKQ